MVEEKPFFDPGKSFDEANPISPGAVVLEGTSLKGKPCRLVDNTATVPLDELKILLQALIEQGKFGPGGLSASGGNTITLGMPESAHVQLNDTLYRLIIFDYEARLERF